MILLHFIDAQYRCTCEHEELAHMEIISAIIHQLTKDLTPEEIAASGFDKYYVGHTLGLWPQAAGGVPFTATFFLPEGRPFILKCYVFFGNSYKNILHNI